MMGRQRKIQKKLFYSIINLDKRFRKDHILRKVVKYIDFDFTYKKIKDKYGIKGNVSVPLPVIIKMMLLLILYNVRSERELMSTIPERLDWLWFLGYDLDDNIPNHSVLSKARTRWGVEAFKTFLKISSGNVYKPVLLTAVNYLWIRMWLMRMPPTTPLLIKNL